LAGISIDVMKVISTTPLDFRSVAAVQAVDETNAAEQEAFPWLTPEAS